MSSIQVPIHINGHRREITLIYLDQHGYGVTGRASGLAYLHRVRQFPTRDFRDTEDFYLQRVLPEATRRLADELGGRTFDVVFSPPSSRQDATPYLAAIKQRLDAARDWTERFRRVGDGRAGVLRSCDAVRAATVFTPDESIAEVHSVLMVDESYSDGATACAMLTLLRQNGLSQDAEFVVAAPLWVVPRPPRDSALKDSVGSLQ
jgi:hypothetical protein